MDSVEIVSVVASVSGCRLKLVKTGARSGRREAGEQGGMNLMKPAPLLTRSSGHRHLTG